MIFYTKGYKYQLDQTYVVELPLDIDVTPGISTDYLSLLNSVLTIKKGYAWDGPSGPTIDTATFMQGALIHDALYQLIRMKLLDVAYRKTADDILHRTCLRDGMWRVRAKWVYRAVRRLGGSSAVPGNVKKVFSAPV